MGIQNTKTHVKTDGYKIVHVFTILCPNIFVYLNLWFYVVHVSTSVLIC